MKIIVESHLYPHEKHRGFLNTAQVVLSSCGFQMVSDPFFGGSCAQKSRKRAAGC